MKKVSLNLKKYPDTPCYAFRSADGTEDYKGRPIHVARPNKPVFTNDFPGSMLRDDRVIIEDVEDKAKKTKE